MPLLQCFDILLIYVSAIIFNFILTSNDIFSRHSFVPGMIFITISSLFAEWSAFDLQTIAQFFLLISMANLFALSVNDYGRERIFYTSLFLSLGSLFYFPVTVFFVILLVGMLLRSIYMPDILLLVTGFILPYYFIGIGMYFAGQWSYYFHFLQNIVSLHTLTNPDFTLWQIIFLSYLLLLVILGYITFQQDSEFKIIKQKRLIYLMMAYFIALVVINPFVNGSKLVYMQMVAAPAAIFVSRLFGGQKLKFYHHILFLLMFGAALFFELYYAHIM